MSLIRVRRDRKKTWIAAKGARRPVKLVLALALVIWAIWYLSQSFGP